MYKITCDTIGYKVQVDGTITPFRIKAGNEVTVSEENQQPFIDNKQYTKVWTWSGQVGWVDAAHVKQV